MSCRAAQSTWSSLRTLSRSLRTSARVHAQAKAPAKKPPASSTIRILGPPSQAHTFELYQVNPQRITDFKFKFLTGCFIIVVAGANISFAFYDWHQLDEHGTKTYANQTWRLSCAGLTLLSAGGVFWAVWRLSSSNVRRITVHLPESSLVHQSDPRKALLHRYSQGSADIETFLPPHPFSSRSSKVHHYKLSELRLDGPLSQTQKPWHPRGFKYSDPTQRKGKDASHVPISRARRADEPLTDYVKWLRPMVGQDVLPPPSAFHALTPFAVAKDGKWNEERLEEVEQAMLEMNR